MNLFIAKEKFHRFITRRYVTHKNTSQKKNSEESSQISLMSGQVEVIIFISRLVMSNIRIRTVEEARVTDPVDIGWFTSLNVHSLILQSISILSCLGSKEYASLKISRISPGLFHCQFWYNFDDTYQMVRITEFFGFVTFEVLNHNITVHCATVGRNLP